MSRPRAILFDLGETLIHFPGVDRTQAFIAGARAGHACLVAAGLRMPPEEKFVRSMLWRGRKSLLLNRLSRRELDVADMFGLVVGSLKLDISEELWREFILRMYEPLADAGQVDPEAAGVLAALRRAGLKVGLISNTFIPRHALDAHLARAGLINLFDQRFYSSEFGLKKPSLSLFREAVRVLEVRAEEAWHVGDDIIADVLGARRAGVTPVLRLTAARKLAWWWRPLRPRMVIHRLSELLGLLGLSG